MSLGRNKRGIELSTLAEILLIVIATSFIITFLTVTSARADEKTSENLCRGLNAWRFGTEIETPVGNVNLVPRACKTINKKDVPSKDYINHVNGQKAGAMAEVRDLMARCWWMWLEGNQQNMFQSEWYNLQNGCFICYTFSVDKDAKAISYQEFAASLNAPYYAVDSSDRCAPAGQGGKCMAYCDKNSDFSKEVASTRCKQGLKCCVDANECENKGGSCEPRGNYVSYDKWQCKSGNCYIKEEHMASYLDYIQGTKGVSGGAGRVLFGDNEGFKSGLKYAVTFVSPGTSFGFDTAAGIITTATGATLTVMGVASGIGTIPTLVLIGTTLYSGAVTHESGSFNDINYIMVSKYDTVSDKCAVEAGVGENN